MGPQNEEDGRLDIPIYVSVNTSSPATMIYGPAMVYNSLFNEISGKNMSVTINYKPLPIQPLFE